MMRPSGIVLGALLCCASVAVSAQRSQQPQESMADTARAFLATLSAEQRTRATIPFNSDERLNWHFVPKYMERKGLPLKDMSAPQQKAALALLQAGLSEKGYTKTSTIRELEVILRHVENNNQTRDRELYYFSIFGEPGDSKSWGWRYEGHHCSLNWTVVSGKSVSDSPQFFGTNPAEVRVDVPNAPKRGTRVLAAEEDLGRALVLALNDEQRSKAIVAAKAPNDIFTGASRKTSALENNGIAFSELNKDQQGMLLSLIQEYANAMPRPLAQQRMQKVRRAGIQNVKFAWMGGTAKGDGHYYRVQGPTFLIEYDNTQNNGNHVHCVWRDFNGDFGVDLLARHYETSPHHQKQAE